jgi:AraC family transcriptional regulator
MLAQADPRLMDRTSAEALARHIPGRLLAEAAAASTDLLVQTHARAPVEDVMLIPAVAEPLVVWVVSGAAEVEERDLGGPWLANRVSRGDFFLTQSETPYELRWRAEDGEPFQVMHLYLGLPLLARAAAAVRPQAAAVRLRDNSGARDPVLSNLLDQVLAELAQRGGPSEMLLQGIGEALAVHLVRHYGEETDPAKVRQAALPAFRLRRATAWMAERLDQPFDLEALAREVGMSAFHFSRLFRKATGSAPSQHFIRLRMAEAKRLLRETDRSVIEVALDVGYASPSHFAQVFRKTVGVTPREYRA